MTSSHVIEQSGGATSLTSRALTVPDTASGGQTPSDAGSGRMSPFEETRSPLGRIQFHLVYSLETKTLTLKLICAIDLPAKDFSGTSDPYVKILLLPDRKHKLLSNIKRKNLNPQWNETFAFEGY